MPRAMAVPAAKAQVLHAFGEVMHLTMPRSLTGAGVSVFEEVTQPGGGPPLHVHHREDEVFRVLDGTFRIRCGDDTHDVTAGDTILLPRGVPHAFFNAGAEPGRLLIILQPGGFERFFEEVLAAGLEPPRDMPAIAEVAARYGLEFVGPNPFQAARP